MNGGFVKSAWTKAVVAMAGVLCSLSLIAGSASAAPLTYYGGEVQNSPHVYLTFWGKNWNSNSAARTEIIKTFSGISGSAWQGILTQYYDSTGFISPNITFSSWTDESIAAPNDVSDEHLEQEIEYSISKQGWPAGGMDNQYIVLPAPGSKYHAGFVEGCGAHRYSGKLNAPYSHAVWPGEAAFAGCADYDPSGQDRPWAGMAVAASHEYAETVTDPVTVKYAGYRTGWLEDDLSTTNEIADKCALLTPPSGYLANGAPVHKLWDNYQNQCSLSDPSPPQVKLTKAKITQSTALNGNPGWATVVGEVTSPGLTVSGKTAYIKFFKWNVSTTKWDEKAVVPTAVNNNKFELVNWNGVGNGSWIAKAEFPSQGGYGASSSNTVTEGAFLVKDGYRFKVKHTEKCLDVYAGLTANGTAINQWDCLNPATTSNQVFTMVPTGSNGAVRIVARHSNRCVSVKGGSTAPGTYLEQYDCAGGEQPGQTWRTEKMTGNWSRLIAKHSNQCMDVRGQETANGVPVTQYTCLGTQANQMWEIQSVDAGPIPTQTELYVPDGETLYGRPYGYSTAYGYVRTGAYNIAGNTLKLSYYKQNGAGNYEYIKAVNPTINSEGRFEVKYEGFGPGEWIVKADFPGVGNFAASGSPERWFHVGDGYRYVFRHSGKCLTLNGNYNYNGNIFVQWDCAPVATPYDGQVFAMHPIEGGARFNITVNSTGKCLDVTGGSTANGAAFQQYDCNGSDQQRFQVIPIYMQPPWNALIAKHSNKCMDVYSQYTSNGALIHQWECLWPGSQQWQFQRIG